MSMIRDPEGIEHDALARINALHGVNLLEIGCGDGRLTGQLAELAARVVAIDSDAALVKSAPPHPKAAFMAASAIEIPFPTQHFDTVLLAWSL